MSRSDAPLKLRGGARYGTDLFEDGMLYAALVPAPAASGGVRRLDLRAARGMPGVRAVVGPEEVGQLLPKGGSSDRPVFPRGEIGYRGQPLAVVAADTLAQARAAAAAVVVEIEPKPAVHDVESVFPEWPGAEGPSSPHVVAHVRARRGDLEAAFSAADFVQSDLYRTSGVHQVAIEPHACLARSENGGYRVLTSTQTPFGTREDTAEVLGIPEDRLVVEGTWVGGGFGGKGSSFLEPYAIVLAAATGRPVRLTLTHREEFLLGRTTLPAVFRLESAVKDGEVTARRVRMLLDSGASLPGRDFATGYAIGFLLGPYRLSTFDLEGYAVRTHKPPFGPHRAPLAPQCVFAIDQHVEAIARRSGNDPIGFRRRSAWTEGDTTPMGQTVGPFGLGAALEAAHARAAEWRKGLADGHGIGVACGFWSTGTGAGGEAMLRLTATELVIVEGEREIGSGSIVAGLVALASETLGMAASAIRVEYRDTASAPYDTGVFGSRTLGALGQAVEKAAQALRSDLGSRLKVPPESIRIESTPQELVVGPPGSRTPIASLFTEAERAGGAIVASGRHYGRGGQLDDSLVLEGGFYPYTDFTGSVALAEVEVDRATGAVRPVRIASFLDVGVAIDRALVTAQVEGAVAMGLGTTLTEEMLWGPDGRLANPNLLDYRIPTLGEIPPIEVHLLEGFAGAGPRGAKGVGEPPIIPVPAAIANAVFDAVGARVYELPMTSERVARALKLLEGTGSA